MIYRHEWGAPAVVMVPQAGRRVATPQQACVKCGTTKNALTHQLIRTRKAEYCRDAPAPPERDFRVAYSRLRDALAAYEADGFDVDREYGQRKKSAPELPLAYKD